VPQGSQQSTVMRCKQHHTLMRCTANRPQHKPSRGLPPTQGANQLCEHLSPFGPLHQGYCQCPWACGASWTRHRLCPSHPCQAFWVSPSSEALSPISLARVARAKAALSPRSAASPRALSDRCGHQRAASPSAPAGPSTAPQHTQSCTGRHAGECCMPHDCPAVAPCSTRRGQGGPYLPS